VTRYTSYRSYLTKRFGRPVLKVPLNAGFSCPNRDGTISRDGCSFCDNRSFSPVATAVSSIIEQLKCAIGRDKGRHSAFIAYLQPFTNTYGTVQRLREVYEPIIAHPGIVGLAVGTRPDCLGDDICEYLRDVSKRTYLSVEIGLQSASDQTLRLNKRGHSVDDFVDSVKRLAAFKIETVAHVIIGLPGDSKKGTIDTAKLLSSLPVSGVKIHQLMIIDGTEVHEWFKQGRITPVSLDEYSDILCDFLSHLRPDQHIHRIMADSTVKNGLVAPLWSAEKMKSVKRIHEVMEKRGLKQGASLGR
jgi:radical SAM protein (TIGR01212 family)